MAITRWDPFGELLSMQRDMDRSFERSIMLPEGVDPDSIHADIKDGVLEVSVPKAAAMESPRTRKIEIGPGK